MPVTYYLKSETADYLWFSNDKIHKDRLTFFSIAESEKIIKTAFSWDSIKRRYEIKRKINKYKIKY